ncbi:hypothetical protein AOLI_G00198940 [Acnodon oligacanthus]
MKSSLQSRNELPHSALVKKKKKRSAFLGCSPHLNAAVKAFEPSLAAQSYGKPQRAQEARAQEVTQMVSCNCGSVFGRGGGG